MGEEVVQTTLPRPLAEHVKAMTSPETGAYISAEEYLRDLVRRDMHMQSRRQMDDEDDPAIQAQLDEATADVEQGRVSSFEEVLERRMEARRRLGLEADAG